VGGEQNVTTVLSMSRNQTGPLEQWIDEHPPGMPILVRYDPADHTEAVTTDKLVGGPHTQGNINVLEACAGSFVILLAIARITRLHQPDPIDVLP